MSKQRERVKRILDWEELEKAPNTHGAFSFLRSAAQIVSIRRNDVPPQVSDQGIDAVLGDKTTTVSASATVANLPAKMSRIRPYKVHRCTLVQHGQSLGETVLYQSLWAHGRAETPDTRTITAGWRTMKKLCNMTDKNCKRNTGLLIKKLAVEEIGKENVNSRTGRTYRIYSFTKTLERRKAAGMEWAVWDRGRRFVQSDGSPLEISAVSSSKTTTVVAPTPAVEDTVAKATPVTGVNAAPGTMVNTTTALGSLLGIEERKLSSTTHEVVSILEALGQQADVADERAALQLLKACRSVCPDARAEEIVGVIREKGAVMQTRRDVRNPIGFLLTSVPCVFVGDGIKTFRRHVAAAAALAEERRQEEDRKRMEMIEWLLSERNRLTLVIQDAAQLPKRQTDALQQLSEVESLLSSYGEDGT